MDLVEGIKSRKSVRGYKPDPVPKDLLKEIIDIAARAPSSMNTQPWEFTVIAGDVINKIRQANVEKFNAGERPQLEVTRGEYTGKYRDRQVALAVQLFQLMGITREDREKRTEWMRRGFRFFDAPAAIILSMDKSVGQGGQLDIGTISQTIALAAHKYGLGTCIQGQGIMYPDVIRKFTSISDSKLMVIAITIGYPDWDFPANKLETPREPLEKFVTWCGFD